MLSLIPLVIFHILVVENYIVLDKVQKDFCKGCTLHTPSTVNKDPLPVGRKCSFISQPR